MHTLYNYTHFSLDAWKSLGVINDNQELIEMNPPPTPTNHGCLCFFASKETPTTPQIIQTIQQGKEHTAAYMVLHKAVSLCESDKQGKTPLIHAAQNGYHSLIKLMSESSRSFNTNHQDLDGMTALMHACAQDKAHAALILITDLSANTDLLNHQGQSAEDLAKLHKSNRVLGLLEGLKNTHRLHS